MSVVALSALPAPLLPSLDTTTTSTDTDDSFSSQTSTDSLPSTPASPSSATKPTTLPERPHSSDFVLHYNDTAFAVRYHTLVRSSTYFTNHLRLLPSPIPCRHCHATQHCHALPSLHTLHSKLTITPAQLQTFLDQLHNPHQRPPLFAPSAASEAADESEWSGPELGDALDVEAFLTLARLLGCEALLARCDEVLLRFYGQLPAPVDLWMAWDRLVPAHCFGLARLRAHCLMLVSRDTRMDGEYEESRMALKRQAGVELYQQLMDEVGELIVSRARSRICRHRTSLLGREAASSLSELASLA